MTSQKKRGRINSRAKGASFERLIARELSSWCGFSCRRTPASGGWAKTGDITPNDPKEMVSFPFCLELKKRQDWDLLQLMTGRGLEGSIKSWWKQCLRDAKQSKKMPLLLISKNHCDIYCMLRRSDFKKLELGRVAKSILILPGFCLLPWRSFLEVSYSEALERLGTRT